MVLNQILSSSLMAELIAVREHDVIIGLAEIHLGASSLQSISGLTS